MTETALARQQRSKGHPLLGMKWRLLNSLQVRREQNRKAQQIFKARRLAAQTETKNRIAHLEKTVESMAELFLNLTDNVMKLVSVRQNSDLSQHIQDSLLQCLSLVRGSITVDCEGDNSERVCTDLVSSPAQDSSHHKAVPLTARFDQYDLEFSFPFA